MLSGRHLLTTGEMPPFSRKAFAAGPSVGAVGTGYIGGKATGLVTAAQVLAAAFPEGVFEGVIRLSVPRLAVIGTDIFDEFVTRNGLEPLRDAGESDERIARAFRKADFPVEFVGDLRAITAAAGSTPLAVRSSSLLEDATFEPFAGIYGTKMIPNREPDTASRFERLIEAIKFVYATTWFRDARGFRERTEHSDREEKMAVIIQEVVGRGHHRRFYPVVSGVARSWNCYPMGKSRPEDGVINLALGLGKTIVDGDPCWSYSPAHPHADPPVSVRELLQRTQTRFWCVNLGKPPAYDPMKETEFLSREDLAEAELDNTLRFVASTYVPESDRIVEGIGRSGPRVLNFAPLIRMGELPLTGLVRELLGRCEEALSTEVEIEFAMDLDPLRKDPPAFGFLQVRPIVVSRDEVDLEGEDASEALAVSNRVLGHGLIDTIQDVVYVRPDVFEKRLNPRIAGEIGEINAALREAGRDYVLFTFGRLGSSDPWLGVPVDWGQISRARVIVEATTPDFDVELSQGAHFFHNMTSLGIFYFTVPHTSPHPIHFDRLEREPVVRETPHVRHVRLSRPLRVLVDGRRGRGMILP